LIPLTQIPNLQTIIELLQLSIYNKDTSKLLLFLYNVVYQDVGHIIISDTLTEFPTPFIPYVFSPPSIMSVITQETKIILAIEAIRTSKKLNRRKAAKLY
jgi:hypothetical protein